MRLTTPFLFCTAVAIAQLQITTSSVPTATQYQSYNATLAANGGSPPYSWSVVASSGVSLPEGMSLDAASSVQAKSTGRAGTPCQSKFPITPLRRTARRRRAARGYHAVGPNSIQLAQQSDPSRFWARLLPRSGWYPIHAGPRQPAEYER